ncbi:hypothetical protein [Burkholderia sp. 22PA0106]|uniref:hypothetical protein n=1 Tax=Burkholderia sp. 22PA0106 TaxID=3237371 RepID=UPI0039C421F8
MNPASPSRSFPSGAAESAASMRGAMPALLLGASLLLGACGKHDANGASGAAAPAPGSAASAVSPASSAAALAASIASAADAAQASSPDAASGSGAFSQGLKRADLMHVVFPAWRDTNDANARVVEVELPVRDDSGRLPHAAAPKTETTRVEIAPRQVIRLDDTHAVMLTEGVGVADTGVRDDSYASGAWLGAYFFRRDATGWLLDKRVDGVDYLGVAGTYGDTSVARIGADEFGVVLTGGGCWQGFCGTWASVYGVAPGRIATYASTVPVDGNNLGASGDCETALQQPGAAKGAAASDTDVAVGTDASNPPACFDISGKLALVTGGNGGSEMQIRFDGVESTDTDDGTRSRQIHQTAVYQLRGGKYVLSSGHNPVPPF